ncbi:DUF6048 family protein [Flavobacterium sp. K5-23]|uniref:DUF6048 family protein n=1 Tax=Flavobacterium sp. K5-23 TaxID=2746225 RepID=UPI00200DD0F4|nr:DUF6048 family protein [Flavobacterium sp. K5-23]UQD56466.1 hypothetical protein FLAK523_08755 [Flavobacterium sp. K5-23]
MKHTLKYFFSICLLTSFFLSQAQETTKKVEPAKQTSTQTEGILPGPPVTIIPNKEVVKKTDTIPVKKDRYGLRVGIDLFKLTKAFYDKDYKGLELAGDFRLNKKYYLAAEIGNENKTTDDDRLNFTTKGSYLKVGFDYNAYENWLDMENIISIGMRYGVSTFSQELNNYKIYNANPYFGQVPAIATSQKFDGLTASWIEVVAGVKAKVFDNVFMGFSLRLNTLITNKKPDNFDNLYIPGFNRTYDGSFGVGINYTVSYFIPLYKKKVVAKKVVTTKK